mgnify:CR=1 FL=1
MGVAPSTGRGASKYANVSAAKPPGSVRGTSLKEGNSHRDLIILLQDENFNAFPLVASLGNVLHQNFLEGGIQDGVHNKKNLHNLHVLLLNYKQRNQRSNLDTVIRTRFPRLAGNERVVSLMQTPNAVLQKRNHRRKAVVNSDALQVGDKVTITGPNPSVHLNIGTKWTVQERTNRNGRVQYKFRSPRDGVITPEYISSYLIRNAIMRNTHRPNNAGAGRPAKNGASGRSNRSANNNNYMAVG